MPRNQGLLGIYLLMTAGLTACGGDGGNGGDAAMGVSSTAGTGTAYPFVPPVVNSSRVYTETFMDNSNDTIVVGYRTTIAAIAADGTITEQQQSTTVWTDNIGTTHTQTTTNWIDTATFHSVKESITYLDTGTTPLAGYAISREIDLQSTS